MRNATAITVLLLGFAMPSFAAAPATHRTPIVEAVEKASPAVVNISTERIVVMERDPVWNPFFDDPFREFFGRFRHPGREFKTQSLGSGVILHPDGFLVTNEHVVARASKITVTFADKTQLTAELLASDSRNDLALLKASPAKPLAAIALGTPRGLLIGETAIAVGNPFGLESTVTVGVISAKNRSIVADGKVLYEDFLQTDASINPGNSGGALLDIEGRLIGINSAINPEGQGIGFAIPADRAMEVAGKLLSDVCRERCWLGATLAPRDPGAPRAEIAAVEPKSPAAEAGLAPEDIVLAADGRPVRDFLDFAAALFEKKPGEAFALTIERKGTPRAMAAKLAPPPAPPGLALADERLGISVQEITADLAGKLDLPVEKGLLVTNVAPDGPAARIGIRRGDCLLQIGRTRIESLKDLQTVLESVRKGRSLAIRVFRRPYGLLGGEIEVR
ncbi:MAG: trypsin-like peptidase domain-containing protein [Planctomycetota bacterium]